MSDSILPSSKAPAADTLLPDRRRQGRMAHDNPALIALLRSPFRGAEEPDRLEPSPHWGETEAYEDSGLRASRGIARGLIFVAPFWAAIAMLWWFL